MRITRIGEPTVIMSNPGSKHNYFGWPSVARLQNGKIAVVASGFRLRHVCPFGKTVIAYSEDEGEHYTCPAPVIDTTLDDRDGGITAFGKSSVIVTSFNNTVEFQKCHQNPPYLTGYLNEITKEEEKRDLGVTFRISHDCGVTFGPIMKSPITSPHGPVELPGGNLLWIGRRFSSNDRVQSDDCIEAHLIHPDGSMEYVGRIGDITLDGQPLLSCEPHAILLNDGSILVHIRAQARSFEDERAFTIFQTISHDGGKTWEPPYPLLDRLGGSPPHLFRHSSGVLLCTYGVRVAPYKISVMFSNDEGKNWETGHDLYINGVDDDLGYPATAECADGSLLTVFYAHNLANEPAVIMQQKWKFEE